MDCNHHLDSLTRILDKPGRKKIYPCIRDLVMNGLQVSRFPPTDRTPNRQEITQYLAAWCREVRLSEETCRTWLCDFALSRLSPLSSSSPSSIRHSTKSNVKYIYRSAVPFVCKRQSNKFKADCSPDCPVYNEMEARAAAIEKESRKVMEQRTLPTPLPTPSPSVKDIYREQFLSAKELITLELSKGTKRVKILDLLKEKGLKTITGKDWNYGTLTFEILKLRDKNGQN